MVHQKLHFIDSDNLHERHLQLCAEDVARVATIIIANNKHSEKFARQAATSRRLNRTNLVDPPISINTLFNGMLINQHPNFRSTFQRAQNHSHIPKKGDAYHLIADRVLADSSPYLYIVERWMQRNRTTRGFTQYMNATNAVRLLHHCASKTTYELRSEGELKALIQQGVQRLHTSSIPAAPNPLA